MSDEPKKDDPVELRCPKCREKVTIPREQADTALHARCSKGHEFEIARAI